MITYVPHVFFFLGQEQGLQNEGLDTTLRPNKLRRQSVGENGYDHPQESVVDMNIVMILSWILQGSAPQLCVLVYNPHEL